MSGVDRTGASMVLHKVTWRHEVVYTSQGKPATFQDLSIPIFIQGYLIIINPEEWLVKKQMAAHLQDLMSDAQMYGWERVRTFQGVWLNQIEQWHYTWMDREEMLKFRKALVWHAASSCLSAPPMTKAMGMTRQHSHKAPAEYNAPARPGTKACQVYNILGCSQEGKHPNQQHICSFCLVTINRATGHG